VVWMSRLRRGGRGAGGAAKSGEGEGGATGCKVLGGVRRGGGREGREDGWGGGGADGGKWCQKFRRLSFDLSSTLPYSTEPLFWTYWNLMPLQRLTHNQLIKSRRILYVKTRQDSTLLSGQITSLSSWRVRSTTKAKQSA